MRILSLVLTFVMSTTVVNSEIIRDYYAEPGLNPYKDTLNQNANEQIDPFSGHLSITHTDLVLPGNGGLDIVINRVYNNLQDSNYLGMQTVTGVGWTMHYGRVVMYGTNADKLCSQNNWSVTTRDNPTLELPDGSRQLLLLSMDQSSAYLITKNNWKAECNNPQGLIVTSPDGTKYIMDQYDSDKLPGQAEEVSYYTSKIIDTNGNSLSITYTTTYDQIYINTILASDGRAVNFTYDTSNPFAITLSTITANGQTWRYNYVPATPNPSYVNYRHLAEVVSPELSIKWQYSYHPYDASFGAAGNYSLKQMIYPTGGAISYEYGLVEFDQDDPNQKTTVVIKKTVSGKGDWTFKYKPAKTYNQNNNDFDKTIVRTPNGKYVYRHYGYNTTFSGGMWLVGLLFDKKTFEIDDQQIQTETNDWDKRLVSTENYSRGSTGLKIDNDTYAPILLRKVVARGGENFATVYENYDQYGNPQKIIKGLKETSYVYQNDLAKWIIGQVIEENLLTIGKISRNFNDKGNMTFEDRYGLKSYYAYNSNGDIASITTAGLLVVIPQTPGGFKRTTYGSYYRGVPRITTNKVSDTKTITTTKVINSTGTVRSSTNGRGFTSSFTYDNLNRLTAISFPKANSAAVTVSYTANSKTLTRGNFQETVQYDGYGQTVNTTRRDLFNLDNITTTSQYDALGNKTFESYPNSSVGTQSTYDVLGRVLTATHPDGTFVSYEYRSGKKILVTNERGFVTKYKYRVYGHPDNKVLRKIISPENITTIIKRNLLDKIVKIWQGDTGGLGITRKFKYDINNFLIKKNEPEVGSALYGRDNFGNLISSQVNNPGLNISGITTYTYDYLNRLIATNYPGLLQDITVTYDDNNNVINSSNGNSLRQADFDANDNLITETITNLGNPYIINYTINDLDLISDIIYPITNRTISYSPDAFGRPTTALPYVTDVSYYPSGQVQQMLYANGETTANTLDNRLRIDSIAISGVSNTVWLQYLYDGSNNVTSITNYQDRNLDRSFAYDGVDRLTLANATQWGTIGDISYDTKGNITTKNIGSLTKSYNYTSNRLTSVTGNTGTFDYTNRYSYDVYGNVSVRGAVNYDYDDVGNLIVADNNGNQKIYYAYDANNMRVNSKQYDQIFIGDDVATLVENNFVYAANSNLLFEKNETTEVQKEHVYLGSLLVATINNTKVQNTPNAIAGGDQVVDETQIVTLDGSASNDSDGTISTYTWAQTSGSSVTLTNSNTSIATFTTPIVINQEIYGFDLTVTDNDGLSSTDSISVTVNMVDTDGDGLSDNWEVNYFGDLNQTATDDFDLDGYSNLDEFLKGLNPIVADQLDAIRGFLAQPGNTLNTITWLPVDRAISYDLYWSISPGVTTLSGTKISNVTSPYTHNGLTNGTNYYYIIVVNSSCCSLESTEQQITTGMSGWSKIALLSDTSVYNYNDTGYGSTVDDTGTATFIHKIKNQTFPADLTVLKYNSLQGWGNGTDLHAAWFSDSPYGNIEGTTVIESNNVGGFVTAWVNINNQNDREIWSSIYTVATGWSTPQYLGKGSGNNNIKLAIDNVGNALVTWFVQDCGFGSCTPNVIKSTRYDVNSGWLATQTLAETNNIQTGSGSGAYKLVFSKVTGNALIAWKETTALADAVKVQYFEPILGWGAVQEYVNLNPNIFGQYYFDIALNDNQQAIVAWDQYNNAIEIAYVEFSSAAGWGSTQILPIDGINPEYLNGWDSVSSNVLVELDNNRNITAAFVTSVPGLINSSFSAYYNRATAIWSTIEDITQYVLTGTSLSSIKVGKNNDVYLVANSNVFKHVSGFGTRYPSSLIAYGLRKLDVSQNGELLFYQYNSTSISVNHFWEVVGAPLANAGNSQRAVIDSIVTLDASNSTDDGLIVSYQWTQISGTTVTLNSPTSASTTFTATPSTLFLNEFDMPLVFELRIVDNEGMVAVDTVRVVIDMAPPVIVFGPEQTVTEGASIQLDATGSSDSNGTINSIYWYQSGGINEPTVILLNETTLTPTLTAPLVDSDQTVTIGLTLVDDRGISSTRYTKVTISNVITP